VDYVIPGNDDALRAIRLFASRVADAVMSGRDMKQSADAEAAREAADEAAAAAAAEDPRRAARPIRRPRATAPASAEPATTSHRSPAFEFGPAFSCTDQDDANDYRNQREETSRPDRRGHDGLQGGARRGPGQLRGGNHHPPQEGTRQRRKKGGPGD